MSDFNQTLLKELQTQLLNNLSQLRQDIIDILMISSNASDHSVALQLHNVSCDELLNITSQSTLAPLSRKTSSIKSIDAALNNIECDMYGICADCEEEIEINRLKLDPTVQRCASCAAKYQKQKYNNFKL